MEVGPGWGSWWACVLREGVLEVNRRPFPPPRWSGYPGALVWSLSRWPDGVGSRSTADGCSLPMLSRGELSRSLVLQVARYLVRAPSGHPECLVPRPGHEARASGCCRSWSVSTIRLPCIFLTRSGVVNVGGTDSPSKVVLSQPDVGENIHGVDKNTGGGGESATRVPFRRSDVRLAGLSLP